MKEYVSKLLHHCRAAASTAEASKIKQAGYHRISAVSTRQFNLNDVSRWTRCLGFYFNFSRQISNCKSLWWKIEAQQKKNTNSNQAPIGYYNDEERVGLDALRTDEKIYTLFPRRAVDFREGDKIFNACTSVFILLFIFYIVAFQQLKQFLFIEEMYPSSAL
ncbi:hypothetical protein D917_04240 [Trichinella nativa]|uniref:Uncharacterized protein n=1 Tax=Trichinella nativa TaxID=6335 RepID=A0A1Y3E6F8_9BILA|nr:hypothetical protein D917_04240 [Trichinella nativa]